MQHCSSCFITFHRPAHNIPCTAPATHTCHVYAHTHTHTHPHWCLSVALCSWDWASADLSGPPCHRQLCFRTLGTVCCSLGRSLLFPTTEFPRRRSSGSSLGSRRWGRNMVSSPSHHILLCGPRQHMSLSGPSVPELVGRAVSKTHIRPAHLGFRAGLA